VSTPAGYVPYHRSSRYLELIGPVYEAAHDPSRVGLRIDERHTNARGFLHAGLLVAVADTIMGHTAQRALGPGSHLVTVSLTTDFTSSARAGDWLEAHATVRRAGRRLSFGASEFTVAGRLVLAASGVFALHEQEAVGLRPGPDPDPATATRTAREQP
jgi:acyl-coenzyme A thioesterase 13